MPVKKIHEKKADDCDGGALAAAALLSDDGFKPYILAMEKRFLGIHLPMQGHVVFLYKDKNGRYGSIGINTSDVVPACAETIDDLVNIISMFSGSKFNYYKVYDLGKKFPDFIDNDKNNDPVSF